MKLSFRTNCKTSRMYLVAIVSYFCMFLTIFRHPTMVESFHVTTRSSIRINKVASEEGEYITNTILKRRRTTPSNSISQQSSVRLYYTDPKNSNNNDNDTAVSQTKLAASQMDPIFDNTNNGGESSTSTVDDEATKKARKAMALADAFGYKYVAEETKKVYKVTPLQHFFYTLLDIWGYIAITLGVALTFGLLLNIAGYAYYINIPEGLVIDTLEHVRMSRELALMQ